MNSKFGLSDFADDAHDEEIDDDIEFDAPTARGYDWEKRSNETSQARDVADAYFFIGRGNAAPVALEGALKMKEITYKHAEGFAAGELKHGPLALVSEATPVFALLTEGSSLEKTLGNVKEVEARGAPVVAVTDTPDQVERYGDLSSRCPRPIPS